MAKDVDDFVTKALGLSFDTLQVPVSSLPDYFEAFTRALRETGAGSDELTKRLCSGGDLRAICFRCGSWVDTPRIGMLSACRAMRRGSIYGPGARLAAGMCQNAACPETETILMWRFHQPLKKSIELCLNQESIPQNRFLRGVLSPAALTYTHDVVFNQTRIFLAYVMNNESLPHLYKGLQFPEKSLWVFGSVLPWNEDARKSYRAVVGKGYLSFTETLLQTAAYYTTDVSVLHWTYLFDWSHEVIHARKDQDDRSDLFLGFFAPHDVAAKREERGSVILPRALLTEDETDYVKGKGG